MTELANTPPAVVDAVNSNCVPCVKVEKHSPLPHAEPIQTFAIGEPFDVTLACLSVVRQCKQNAHGSLAVNAAQMRAPRRTVSQAEFPHDRLMRNAG
jgi:hypothetical protein